MDQNDKNEVCAQVESLKSWHEAFVSYSKYWKVDQLLLFSKLLAQPSHANFLSNCNLKFQLIVSPSNCIQFTQILNEKLSILLSAGHGNKN